MTTQKPVQKRGRKPNQKKQQAVKAPESVVSNDNQEGMLSHTEEANTPQNASTELVGASIESTEEQSSVETTKLTTIVETRVIKTPTFDQLVDQIVEACHQYENVDIDPTYRLLVDSHPFSVRLSIGEERKKPVPKVTGSVVLRENSSSTFLVKLIEQANLGYSRTKNYNFGRYPFTFMLS